MSQIKVGKYLIDISNEDKILFFKAKITKGQLIEYYTNIALIMISHIKNRPLTLRRFPNGIDKKGFYQKDAAEYFPSWIKTENIKKREGGIVHYVLCNHAATLVYLANQAAIELHPWLSRVPKLKNPDRMIFDLDPSPGVSFETVRWAATELKNMLEYFELPAFIMTTGSRGLHIVVPLKQIHTFDFVKDFAQDIARSLIKKFPKKLTLEMLKKNRGKRIFMDTLRNSWGATGIAPYSVRAKEGAPIATPIEWKELATVTPQKYTIKNIMQRIAKKGDVWQDMQKNRVMLTNARKKLSIILLDKDEL